MVRHRRMYVVAGGGVFKTVKALTTNCSQWFRLGRAVGWLGGWGWR